VAGAAGRRHVPAFPTQVVDSTGAGDCWDAGFVAALAMGEDVHAAALIGNAAASFCLRAVGGSAGVPSYAEVRGLAMGGRA
jgi:sugar/nucleoside kinase (ribokinase family)